jgi:hypothetical protein
MVLESIVHTRAALVERSTARAAALQLPLRLRLARRPVPMGKNARNNPGVLDARHDLLPRATLRARFQLDAGSAGAGQAGKPVSR